MNKLFKKLNTLLLCNVIILCCSFQLNAKNMGLICPFENAVEIGLNKELKLVDANVCKWIKEKENWKLNVDVSNKYYFAKDGFYCIATLINGEYDLGIYYFDKFGNMIDGWAKDQEGYYYFFDCEGAPDVGRMCCGWRIINGAWYCFGIDGRMFVNCETPDGVKVGFDGTPVTSENEIHKYSSKLIGN